MAAALSMGAQATTTAPDWPGASAAAPSAAATAQSGGTVYLLLHGLNSDETTWNAAVKKLFGNRCPTLREETDPASIAASRCYRYHFSDTTWPHGDGLSLDQLGAEVAHAVENIQTSQHPAAVVLVGHSRGGLAARVYLQQAGLTPSFKVALLTIGTPHQGTPLARFKPFMDQNQVSVQTVPKSVRVKYQGIPTPIKLDARDTLGFLFSPSMDFLYTDPGSYTGTACASRSNQALCQLNADAKRLRDVVAVSGQMNSRDLVLGGEMPLEAGLSLDLLGNLSIKTLFPMLIPKLKSGDFVRLREYVLTGITGNIPGNGNFCSNARNASQSGWAWSKRNPESWSCNSDGIVPLISQSLNRLTQQDIITVNLSGVFHTEETARTRNLKQLAAAMFQNHGEFQAP